MTTKDCIVITGSNGGIGKALTTKFLDEGFFVIGIDISDLNEEQHNLINLNLDLNKFVKEDDYRQDSILTLKALIPQALEKLFLVNNAALQISKPFEKLTVKDFTDTLNVNTLAPFFLIQGIADELIKNNSNVLNISSIHSYLTKELFTAYAASKAALESVTRSLAVELSSQGVSINSLAPAAIETEMLREGFEDNDQGFKKLNSFHPVGRISNPEEISNFIFFLLNSNVKFLTGSVIPFNGGIGAKLSDPS